MIFKIIIFASVLIAIKSEYVTYRNHKVYKVIPTTDEDVNILDEIRKQKEYSFWLEGFKVGKDNRIMVAPEKQYKFEKMVADKGIPVELILEDVQGAIENQMKKPKNRNISNYGFEYYLTLEEVEEWMDRTAAEYPDIVSIVTIGVTAEGRDIKGMVIDYKKGRERPVIGIMEGGLHAREWITPVTCLWIAKEFLTSTDPATRAMAEDVQWHIFPVTNPDGYVYSFTDNRMWRKNRNPLNATSCAHMGVSDDLSIGVDLNRNFGFMWMHVGASQNPCDIVYAGPAPFSEAESLALSRYIIALGQQGQLMYYLSFHSFSQMLLVPYSHLGGQDVLELENYADLFEIGVRSMDKLKEKHNSTYIVGTSRDILYPTGGGGFDWAKGGANIPIVFLYELRDEGRYGFLLPPEEIIPNNEETMASIVEIDRQVRAMGYYYANSAKTVTLEILVLTVGLIFSIF